MDDSKFFSALIFVIGNYFVTFFVIGLIAAGISLLNKPKPLRTGEVAKHSSPTICFSPPA
jgi:hypothetical protein